MCREIVAGGAYFIAAFIAAETGNNDCPLEGCYDQSWPHMTLMAAAPMLI